MLPKSLRAQRAGRVAPRRGGARRSSGVCVSVLTADITHPRCLVAFTYFRNHLTSGRLAYFRLPGQLSQFAPKPFIFSHTNPVWFLQYPRKAVLYLARVLGGKVESRSVNYLRNEPQLSVQYPTIAQRPLLCAGLRTRDRQQAAPRSYSIRGIHCLTPYGSGYLRSRLRAALSSGSRIALVKGGGGGNTRT